MIVIPAIDIIDGKVVRLSKGDYSSKIEYSSNPVDMAKRFESAGLTHLHLVDLDGAKGGEPKNLSVLEDIVKNTNLMVDFGGGIKSLSSLERVLNSGANEVSLGSIAVKNPDVVASWLEKYRGRLILSADCKANLVSISGWTEDTNLEITDFISSYAEKGLDKVISTDISKDGMLSGPAFELYNSILKVLPDENVIASGGIATYQDIVECGKLGCYGVIVGKAYYEGRITLEELKEAESAC